MYDNAVTMADIINLDSDEESTIESRNEQTKQPASVLPSVQNQNRPGPLFTKHKSVQPTTAPKTSSFQTISARSTLPPSGGFQNARQPSTLERQHSSSTDDSNDMNGPTTRYQKKSELELAKLMDSSKFLADFDPETSIREKRKLNRKSYTETKVTGKLSGTLYDEKGIHRETGIDLCDCLDKDCVGCHFPCSHCASTKCGQACRVNRKWCYECIEYDGKDQIKKNPLLNR